MIQSRVKYGHLFEKQSATNGWVMKTTKPILKWNVVGKNNIEKIKNSDYNPEIFATLENQSLLKYDIHNPTTGKYREVKSYFRKEIQKWTLYSEPYFKIATRSQTTQITTSKYNDFIEKFFIFAKKIGLLDKVQGEMVSSNEGIVLKDYFIPQDKLEFRTIINPFQWGGYHRIQIQFREKI